MYWQGQAVLYDQLLDARRAASSYLERLASQLNSASVGALRQASEEYQNLVHAMAEVWPIPYQRGGYSHPNGWHLVDRHELVGDVPQILLQYADALAMANGGRVTSEARALVVRALAIEPENVTALWLAGLAAAESGERGAALDYLGRARDLVTQTGAPTDELDAMIRRLESDPAEAPPTVAGSASVTVEIAVDPVLNGRFEAEDVLFVFAQTAGERGPPLAVTRVAAGSLPREVVLDDTMAMAPNVTLRRGETVTVTARISRVGRPAARSGDLEGHSEPFVVSDSGEIALVIDGVVE